MDSLVSLGTDRFEIRGRLGAGAFGDVFRVYDRHLQTVVALKTLHRMEPAALYHFKKEFRGLADVHHPNLVELYELLSVDDRWFFTMELVEGCDFLEHVGISTPDDETVVLPPPPKVSNHHKLRRLRSDLEQLTRGLCTLHRAGKLHCDVKPSNIRVSRQQRLVLLDFGLLRETPGTHVLQSGAGEVMGTPAYMAPEQAAGEPLTEASDWYAVGSVLYEALVGRRPFTGSVVSMLQAKRRRAPQPPKDLNPAVPDDLSELCRRLLTPDPEARPTGDEILEFLGGTMAAEPIAGFTFPTNPDAVPFVGRDKELATLFRQLEKTGRGKAVAVFLHGASGFGKTAVVDRFIDQLRRQRPDAVVLSGRCYERESVPYKGLDPLIDTLSRYLKSLADDEIRGLIPADVLALVRLFPVLERVPAVARAPRDVLDGVDDRELRGRARAVLREILHRLAERGPVVLRIDDLHWGDRDSTHLLQRLLFAPSPPPILLVSCYRRDLIREANLLEPLLGSEARSADAEVCEIAVGRMSFVESCDLGRRLWADRTLEVQNLIRGLARESGGSPYLMSELVHYARSESLTGEESSATVPGFGFSTPQEISLENLIWNRIEKLPPGARALLDVVAVAGQPVDLEAALRAAGLGSQQFQGAVMKLQAGNLARPRGDRRRRLEIYHDRIRETTVQGLDPARLQRLHRRLAEALESTGRADVETLATHFHAAGDRDRAAELAVAAAERASAALAFDRAARLYRLAVDLGAAGLGAELALRVTLADALAKAGRRREAAEAYLEAAPAADGIEALELRRRATAQQLLNGDLGAFDTFRQLLRSTGIRLPRTVFGARLSFLWLRWRLKLRGLEFRLRAEKQVPAEELFRIDACWSGAGAALDPPRWLELGSRHLLLALEAGEPRRIVRALVHETFLSATGGWRRRRRTATLVQLAMRLAKQVDDPFSLGLAHLAAGLGAFFEGRWQRAGEHMEACESLLRGSIADWELAFALDMQMLSLWWQGRVAEFLRRLPSMLTDAVERGSLFAEILLLSRADWLARLTCDQVEEAERGLRKVGKMIWPQFRSAKFYQIVGTIEIALYRGDGAEAWRLLCERWPEVERTTMLTIELGRTDAWQLRCRGALAAAVAAEEPGERARLIDSAKQDLRRLESQRLDWSDPLAQLLRAGVATLEGEVEQAAERLTAAEVGFETAEMELYATVSRLRRGQLAAATGQGGDELLTAADRWMLQQGIRKPGRMADALAPGVWDVTDSRTT